MDESFLSSIPTTELLHFSVENVKTPIFWVTPHGVIFYANQCACDHLGYTLEELKGMTVSQFSPEFKEEQIKNSWDMLKKNKTINFTGEHLTKDGSLKMVNVIANYVQHGDQEYRVAYTIDMEQKIKKEKHISFLYEVIDLSTDPVFIVKIEDLKIMYANRTACEELQYTFSELTNLYVKDVRTDFADSSGFENFKDDLKRNGSLIFDCSLIKKNGEHIPVESRLTFMEHQGEEYFISIARDISARIEYERRLEIKALQLEKMNLLLEEKVVERTRELELRTLELEQHKAMLEQEVLCETERRMKSEHMLLQQKKFADMGRMISAIAHQWRQPLNALALLEQDLTDAYDFGEISGDTLKEHTDAAMKLINHMSSTVDDFRRFFMPNKKPENYNITNEIMSLKKMVSPQLGAKGISVIVRCTCPKGKERCSLLPDDNMCEIDHMTSYGFPGEFKQAAMNLIYNAADSTVTALEKRIISKGLITIDISSVNDDISISVLDNGTGIREDIMHRIFEPYFTTKSKKEGTGIGLYMTKIVVEQHLKGVLTAENRPDGGANFTITIPSVLNVEIEQ